MWLCDMEDKKIQENYIKPICDGRKIIKCAHHKASERVLAHCPEEEKWFKEGHLRSRLRLRG